MFHLRRPGIERKRRFLEAQSELEFTYAEVSGTKLTPPRNYVVDHTRVALGEGNAIFQKSRRALEEWEQFNLGWLEAWPPGTRICAGETVIVVARVFRVWSLNAARIVYVVDESSDDTSRFGFAYGTLPSHVEAGEERFLIEWNHSDNQVWYDILAFSRPRHWLTRLGNRQVRRFQKRFAQESAAAMQRAVATSAS